jgi:hypothetical protein
MTIGLNYLVNRKQKVEIILQNEQEKSSNWGINKSWDAFYL